MLSGRVFGSLLMFGLMGFSAFAFPPAPFIQVHGVVRDEFGWVLDATDAFVLVNVGEDEVARGRIGFDPLRARSYELRLPVSSFAVEEGAEPRSNTLDPGARFTFSVELDGEIHLPIEVAFGEEFTGNPGEIVEVDLTLGADTDRDGLPDDWEYFQLQSAGISPGSDLYSLNTLSLEADTDGDGQSNLAEFTSGTFAFDAVDVFQLENIEYHAATGMFEMKVFVVFGKRYQLLENDDLSPTLHPVTLRRENRSSAPGQLVWTSNFTGFTSIYARFDPAKPIRFFRLKAY